MEEDILPLIMLSLLSSLFTFICVLLSVAFFILLERKGLRYIQGRKGPNKVGFVGLPQPLADAVKLLTKEVVVPAVSNKLVFLIGPILSLFLALLVWQLVPDEFGCVWYKYGILFFLCVSSLNVYGTLMVGWSSNSKYALLGSIRAIAQTISYEVSIRLILIRPLFLALTLDVMDLKKSQGSVWLCAVILPSLAIWFVRCLAETNRAPFDFAEGERELVSGFNVEYGRAGFALIFLAEYANILVISLFTTSFFCGGLSLFDFRSGLGLYIGTLSFSFIFVWCRGSLPRFRYDLLIGLTWKSFLPARLCILMVVRCLQFLV